MATAAEQEALVDQLCSITNSETPSARTSARHLLEAHRWDLNAAVDAMYQGPGEAGLGRANSSGSSGSAGSSDRRHAGKERAQAEPTRGYRDSRPVASRTGLGTANGSGLIWPLNVVWGLVSSLWYFLVRSIVPLSFLPYLPRFLLPPSPHPSPSSPFHSSPIKQSLSVIQSVTSDPGVASRATAAELPAFYQGGYKEFLRHVRDEGVVGVAVVMSGEHEDDPAFKRDVLADAELARCLKENEVVVWLGDIRYQEGYQVCQTLQLTTFPSLTFFSLLPAANSSVSSGSSSRSKLTILTTVAGPPSSTTSSASLVQLITTSVIPRTRTYLNRLKRERTTAVESRRIRAEQDRAVEASERADRERMLARRRELEAAEAARQLEQLRAERAEREKAERKADRIRRRTERLEWRRWVRKCALEGESSTGGLRVMVRVPTGVGKTSRNVRSFSPEQDISKLFNWVETLVIAEDVDSAADSSSPPSFASSEVADPARTYWPDERGGEVLRLFTTYPRKEVLNQRGDTGRAGWSLVKEAGGSLVCEIDGADVGDEEESDDEA